VSGEERIFVSMGSNLGNREAHFALALRRLPALPDTRIEALSPVFETDPIGPPPQGPFLNAVVELRSELSPRALLGSLLDIEREAGRSRQATRWLARSLDLDLLLYGERVIEEPGLSVPHPRLAERPFVLEPLIALAPSVRHPALGERVDALAARVRDPEAVRRWTGELPTHRGRASAKTRL
jgi:2-amino-4-hydroxy-6-hydroxymethyldihydropteridine diphosphokinase